LIIVLVERKEKEERMTDDIWHQYVLSLYVFMKGIDVLTND
jgi:hypothetical protein